MLYKAADGSERTARADLSIICDGMYSALRSKLSTPRIRCAMGQQRHVEQKKAALLSNAIDVLSLVL